VGIKAYEKPHTPLSQGLYDDGVEIVLSGKNCMTAPRSTLSLGCASTLIGIATLTLMPGAAAQIIPDDSLGAENSMVGVGAIDGLPAPR
jgi:hypothetical protein